MGQEMWIPCSEHAESRIESAMRVVGIVEKRS